MQTALKVIAGLIVALMSGLWLWGLSLLDQGNTAIAAASFVFPLGAALLCWLAWWVRSCRRRAAGRQTTIARQLVRDRAIVVAGLLALCFVFALTLERLGDKPHQTFVLSVFAAAWVAIGIVSLVFCGVCFVGGGKR